jgi:hypothetical protein
MNDWQTAYSTMAEVAATLSGLLFVALSLKLNVVSREERRWMLLVSQRSFFDLLAVLLLGLAFLVPAVSREVIGWGLLWLSLMRAAWHVSHLRSYRDAELPTSRLMEYIAPMIITVVLVAAGVSVLEIKSFALQLTYIAAIALLLGACQNAWRMLVR